MFFRDIPGHEQEKQRLREMADSGRVPHALLLEGPEGTAKFALARAFAQYLHCEHRADGEACGVCPACRQHAAMQHIDYDYYIRRSYQRIQEFIEMKQVKKIL